jgi:GAF domain-containing protein
MKDDAVPLSLRQWAESDAPGDEKLNELVRLYAEALDCPRCILYCRQPDLRRANTTHAWWSKDKKEYAVTWESWFSSEWVDEGPPNAEDPLFTAAITDPTPIYIEDIENDPTGLVNVEFEKRVFLHSALIHAPVYHHGKCYGILEPSAFGKPRKWSDSDRAITEWTLKKLGPIVAEYVAQHGPQAVSIGEANPNK